jgi:hypothetical protein
MYSKALIETRVSFRAYGLDFFWLYDKRESFVETNRILDTTVQVLHFVEKLTVVPGFAKLSGQIFSSMNAIIPGGNS